MTGRRLPVDQPRVSDPRLTIPGRCPDGSAGPGQAPTHERTHP